MQTLAKEFVLLGVVLLFGGRASADEFVRVDATGLRVRQGPGTRHRILGKTKDGQILRVLGRSGRWVHVMDGVRRGWVYGSYINPIEPRSQHVTARSGLKVRSGPGIRYRQLGVLNQYANVQVLETRGKWRKIAYKDSTGWVYGGYLMAGAPPAQPRVGATDRLRNLFGEGDTAPSAASSTTAADRPAVGTVAADDSSRPRAQPAARGRGRVVYNRRVSDATTRDALQRLADHLGKTVVVHSGDRNTVVRGSNPGSLHIRRRAADFHVTGMSDSSVFDHLLRNHAAILGGGSYEVIIHRPGTNTGGPHLHLGNYGDRRGTYYKSERRGRYTRVAHRR